jgi:hypothetical protein
VPHAFYVGGECVIGWTDRLTREKRWDKVAAAISAIADRIELEMSPPST